MNLQEQKVAKVWESVAKEDLKIETISGERYAFGSELACRRLDAAFKSCQRKCGFSKNRNSWFFVLYSNQTSLVWE